MHSAMRSPRNRAHRDVTMLAILVVFAVGCAKREVWKFHMEKVSSFYASGENQMDDIFYVPEGFDGSALGFSIQDSTAEVTNPRLLSSNLSRLRLTVELFCESSNSFYRAELPLSNNYA